MEPTGDCQDRFDRKSAGDESLEKFHPFDDEDAAIPRGVRLLQGSKGCDPRIIEIGDDNRFHKIPPSSSETSRPAADVARTKARRLTKLPRRWIPQCARDTAHPNDKHVPRRSLALAQR